MTSSRLPGKQLALLAERPAIAHLFDRLAACRYVAREDIVLCVPDTPDSAPLEAAAAAEGVSVFRGSELDIIERYHGAVSEHRFDAVVQVDGDDPCADPEYMDLCMERLLADDDLDVVVPRGLPLGIAAKAIRASALASVHESYVPADNSTGYSLYLTASELCRLGIVEPVSPDHVDERARITLDYPEDLAFFEAVFAELYRPAEIFGVGEIVALCRRRPDLVELNAFLTERYWERSDGLIAGEELRYRRPNGELARVAAP